ncbi:MAG: hypothetical protein OK454_02605, partial [Thaumarchaeota archaeon]|nr:hypothetical protein [Nitrososphaerota archaeon]
KTLASLEKELSDLQKQINDFVQNGNQQLQSWTNQQQAYQKIAQDNWGSDIVWNRQTGKFERPAAGAGEKKEKPEEKK